jgi:prepilin-type N-terminal cleavage/methylation domain-containing protein
MFNNAIARARQVRRDEGGFTLIELLIVILILGVLAGIVVFSVRGIQDHGEASACKTEFRTVDTAIEAYYAKNTSNPTNLQALVDGGFLHSVDTEYVTGMGGTPLAATGTDCSTL